MPTMNNDEMFIHVFRSYDIVNSLHKILSLVFNIKF